MTLLNDLQELHVEVAELAKTTETTKASVAEHEEQINGRRGLQSVIDSLALEVRSLRRAAYWLAGVIVAGSITFAFAALKIVGS